MKTYKKGISLIVLVITVIILAILATTVIVSISNTNIISKANDAVTEYNIKTYEDQLTIAYASWLIDNSGSKLTSVSELESHGFEADGLPDGYRAVIKNGKPEIITVDTWNGTSIATSFSGGTGTSADPYLISSASELAYLAQIVNNGTATNNAHYKLTSNIDLDNKSWTPIGSSDSNVFDGVFDGNNYTIYNLNVSVPNGSAGFFGIVDDDDYMITDGILNLTLENGRIAGKWAGGIARSVACRSVTNCHVVNVDVSASRYAAGICANAADNDISNCTYSGNVTGSSASGIIVGGVSAYVNNCINYGNVTATSETAAGIIGSLSSGSASNCYNYGNIHGVTKAADIYAEYGYDDDLFEIYKCYNYGTVTGEEGCIIIKYSESEAST